MKNKQKLKLPKYSNGKVGQLLGDIAGNIGDAGSLVGLLAANNSLDTATTAKTQRGPIQWQKMDELSMSDLKKGNVASGLSTTFGAAASGAKLGSVAGPLGTAIGGAAGAVGGALKSIFGAKKRRKQLREANEKIRATNQFNFADAQSDLLQSDYYNDNEDTSQMNTFKGGKSPIRINAKHSFTPNALVANGELIRDASGNVSEVKGGKGGHIDDVPANIKPSDTILSNKNINPMTGNTFAEDGKKLTNMEKRMNRNLSRNKSIIAKNTEKLNKSFIDRSWQTLVDMQDAPTGEQSLPRGINAEFSDGKTQEFKLFSPWVYPTANTVSNAVKSAANYVTTSDSMLGRFNGASLRKKQNFNNSSEGVEPLVPFPTNQVSENIPNVELDEVVVTAPRINKQTTTQAPITNVGSSSVTTTPASSTNSVAPIKRTVPSISKSDLSKTPYLNSPYSPLQATSAAKPTSIGKRFSLPQSSQGDGDEQSKEALSYSDIMTDVAALAPTISNMIRGSKSEKALTAEDLYSGNPYESMVLSKLNKMRHNPSNELRAVRDAEARARYNARQTNTAGGVGRAIDTASAIASRRAISDIYANAQNMNNQYASQAANVAAQLGAQKSAGLTQAKQMALDINMKNKAAKTNAMGTALTQLSQYAQNKQVMKNTKQKDKALTNALKMFAKLGMSQQDINSLIG